MAEPFSLFQTIVSHQRGILEARGYAYSHSLAEGLEDESDLVQERAFAIRPQAPKFWPVSELGIRLTVSTMLAQHTKRSDSLYLQAVQTVAEAQAAMVAPKNQLRTKLIKGSRSVGEPVVVYNSTTLFVFRFETEYVCSIPWEE